MSILFLVQTSRRGLLSTVMLLLVFYTNDNWAAMHWADKGERCAGSTKVWYARLYDIPFGHDWGRACRATRWGNDLPNKCIDKGVGGMWGEWYQDNHRDCQAHALKWSQPKKDGCFGPNRQVYSARLWNIPAGQDWVETCQRTDGPNNRGRPDRCVKDTLSTGVWGQWYSETESCSVPLKWGVFKDNGCVSDMATPDANAGGITGAGYRSYSAVLYNTGGDWLEACRRAEVRGRAHNGERLSADFPTACVIADADEALGWVSGAILGAGTALIASPTGPYAAAAAGAAIALSTKAVEKVFFDGVDTSLNVWGVVWKQDSSCGYAPTGHNGTSTGGSGSSSSQQPYTHSNQQVRQCPQNATRVSGSLACSCSAQQTRHGIVWGSDIYTADSSLCRAALHNGKIPSSGGTLSLRILPGQHSYNGSRRNGVTTRSYGPWQKSYRFD